LLKLNSAHERENNADQVTDQAHDSERICTAFLDRERQV